MEIFDYEILDTLPTKAFLNAIIINQQAHSKTMKMMNAQVEFLARILAKSKVPLPSRIFYNDGDDT